MGQGSILLCAVSDRLVFFGGAIRLDCRFDCRRRGPCNVDCLADSGEQLLSQLFGALSHRNLYDFRSPNCIARLLLCNGNSSFCIQPGVTLQFGTLFGVFGAALGLLRAVTQVASKPFKSPEHRLNNGSV
jgi:hypothetical protein